MSQEEAKATLVSIPGVDVISDEEHNVEMRTIRGSCAGYFLIHVVLVVARLLLGNLNAADIMRWFSVLLPLDLGVLLVYIACDLFYRFRAPRFLIQLNERFGEASCEVLMRNFRLKRRRNYKTIWVAWPRRKQNFDDGKAG